MRAKGPRRPIQKRVSFRTRDEAFAALRKAMKAEGREGADIALLERAPRASDTTLADDLAALVRPLDDCPDLVETLEAVLEASIALHAANFGNIQLYTGRDLAIAAQRGFSAPFLDFFRSVSIDDDSACARALRHGRPVIIPDVETDAGFAPYRAVAAEAGYRGVQSTPLVSTEGVFVGIVSTHFAHPTTPSKREMTLLGLYATHAADAIARFVAT